MKRRRCATTTVRPLSIPAIVVVVVTTVLVVMFNGISLVTVQQQQQQPVLVQQPILVRTHVLVEAFQLPLALLIVPSMTQQQHQQRAVLRITQKSSILPRLRPCHVKFGNGISPRYDRPRTNERTTRTTTTRLSKKPSDEEEDDTEQEEEEDDDDEIIDVSNQDWRTFRAKLVMGSNQPPTPPSTKEKSSNTTTTNVQETDTNLAEPSRNTMTTTNDSISNFSSSNSSTNITTTAAATTTAIVEDYDGIGAIFVDNTSCDSTTKTTATRSDATVFNAMQSQLQSQKQQWAYDSGNVIEQGAIILGGVEQEYGFGLRQQYFHKAAILVLDHNMNTFTRGIILNRPTNLLLHDPTNPNVPWQIWYGGDVQGIASSNPEIVCLHSIQDVEVTRVSIPIINDIQWTTFDVAKALVQRKIAKSTDFWVFCGYAGWGPQQLSGELDRKSWYMVTTDSQTVLQELARLARTVDPRDAGLDTWSLLMNMIGRSETVQEHSGDFDDHMLKEWALKHLCSIKSGGGAESNNGSLMGGLVITTKEKRNQSLNPLDRLLKRVSTTSTSETVAAGTVVRASSIDRSPFLLECQELHKSIVLILADDENLTIGVILNRPSAKGLDVRLQEAISDGKSKTQLKVPLRYGGQFAVKGSESLLWLHCNPILKAAKIGTPIGENKDGIWKCTAIDMITAVGKGLVSPDVFVVVAGVSIWMKGNSMSDKAHGMQGEIRIGNYELIPETQVQCMFDELTQQEVLTEENLNKNLIIADRAWSISASSPMTERERKKKGDTTAFRIPIGGLGEGYDEDDDEDEFVYKTDVKVANLSDDALRSWVATFLLGSPSLGE
jgi:putative AlgH/UPF0301 family transcriptional regulator